MDTSEGDKGLPVSSQVMTIVTTFGFVEIVGSAIKSLPFKSY